MLTFLWVGVLVDQSTDAQSSHNELEHSRSTSIVILTWHRVNRLVGKLTKSVTSQLHWVGNSTSLLALQGFLVLQYTINHQQGWEQSQVSAATALLQNLRIPALQLGGPGSPILPATRDHYILSIWKAAIAWIASKLLRAIITSWCVVPNSYK